MAKRHMKVLNTISKEENANYNNTLYITHIYIRRANFLKFYLFILFFLFLAALGLRCCTWAFSSCGERGLLFVVVRGLLTEVASLCCGARALGAQAQ